MNLYLSTSDTAINTLYTSSDGTVLYKTHTPTKLSGKTTTTISRAVPSDIPMREGESALEQIGEQRFALLAQIDWRLISPTIIRFGGKEVEASSYLLKDGAGWGWYTKNRVFTGPDGKEYKWILHNDSKAMKLIRKQLVTNDASQRPIAVYHRKHHGYFHPKREAFLEVLPQAEHMLDIVLITYVFVEKIRKENEEAAATV
ncbi:hypothetical protein CPB85DRAFT_1412059 [Mucidula mucida]|nr:hypothetical protein CPB85DRAFT_1412059 [Mucidula mucida]